jgi:L-fuculose-phosphate aldolase
MEFQYKKDIIEVGRRLYQKGFVASNDGNISVRINDRQILTTVTGVSKGFLGVEDVVLVDRRGEKISGKGEPSSELKMHLVIYDKRPDVKAVVHAHPPVATGFAVAGIPLAQCILPEVVVSLGAVPVAQYGTPSTVEVCDAILPYVDSAEAFLLANHGAVTLGEDVFRAYYRMETVEHFARILLAAKLLGNVNILSREQVEKLVEVRKKMGVKGRFPSCESCGYCDTGSTPEPSAHGGPGSTRAPGAGTGTSLRSTPGAPPDASSRAPLNPAGSEESAGKAGSRFACINDKELVELIANVIKEMTKKA